jgi:hypothetical protein
MPERVILRDAKSADLRSRPSGPLLVLQLHRGKHKHQLLVVVEEDVLQIGVIRRRRILHQEEGTFAQRHL